MNTPKLWLVKRIVAYQYDEFSGFVVRAESENKARQIAGGVGAYLGAKDDERWHDPQFASCTEVSIDGEEGVILADFNAG